MVVWGGDTYESGWGSYTNTGGRYDPVTDSWTPTTTIWAPGAREDHTAVWTGSEMIVWGGSRDYDPDSPTEHKASGGRYDPATDSWTTLSTADVPEARQHHSAVWTGDEMIVWGGESWRWTGSNVQEESPLDTGGHYSPQSDTWWPTSEFDAPRDRADHSAFWIGDEMIVWGGRDPGVLDGGGIYGPSSDLDGDGFCSPADCDETDPSIHDDAPEINDGIDNQCPGDHGYGAVDEISGEVTCTGDGWISWEPQSAATLYQVARSSAPDFSTDCVAETTTSVTYDVSPDPDPDACWYYLVRAMTPNEGSWGLDSTGGERSVVCD